MNLFIIKYILYFLIIKKCESRINVNVTVASTKGGAKVKFNGADLKLVSEKEIKIYNITDYNLKIGARVELGKAPDEVFLKDPTDYGYIYYKYKWSEVKRKVNVKSAEIQDIVNEEVVLTKCNNINNTTKEKKVNVTFHVPVETTISSFWDKNGFQDDIYYNINVNYFKTNLSFTNKWMDNNFKSLKSTFSSKNVGYINVKPGSTIVTKLTAKKTIVLLKVVYSAGLVGNLVANYARLYGKYHFWAPTISNIMKAGNLNNELIINEIIEVKCFTDPGINAVDKATGKKVPIMFINKPFRIRKPKKH